MCACVCIYVYMCVYVCIRAYVYVYCNKTTRICYKTCEDHNNTIHECMHARIDAYTHKFIIHAYTHA